MSFAPSIPTKVHQKFKGMGFPEHVIFEAFSQCQGSETRMLDLCIQFNDRNNRQLQKRTSSIDDIDINKAIELSLKEQGGFDGNSSSIPAQIANYEPLNAEQRVRLPGQPVGLKNVGNTCYVNSLLQTYFMSSKFVKTILTYDPRVELIGEDAQSQTGEKNIKRIRMGASIKLIKSLQKLFGLMIRSQKKYVDPTETLNCVVDDHGQKIPVGDQKDVTEYHLNFLSRIEEGLFYQEKYKRASENQGQNFGNDDGPVLFTSVANGKFQSVDLMENSLISQLYFGKMKQYRTFTQDGESITKDEEIVFGPLIMDIAHKDLYLSLQKYCNYTIEDFRAPNGEISKAMGQNWFVKSPGCLVFQLQRVDFDRKTGMPVKLNDQFTFEKTIYLDRFLLQNKEEANKINKEISILKERLESQEKSLLKMQNYKESSLDITKVLGMAGEFIKNQLEFDMSSGKMLQVDPTVVGHLDDPKKIKDALGIIGSYEKCLTDKMDSLKKNIQEINDEIHRQNQKLSKVRYHLVSILIHDGGAGSGHYYSFNRDIEKDTWMRYNDIHVTEESEENVFKEAFGGFGLASAYCLVYQSDFNIQEELYQKKQSNVQLQKKDVPIEKLHYNAFLNRSLIDEVEGDNILFQDELQEFRFNTYLRNLLDSYKNRYDQVTNCMSSRTAKSPPAHLNSFGCFLKNDNRFEGLFKFYLLDVSLKDSGMNMNLRDLKNQPRLLKILEQRISSLNRPYGLSHLTLTKEEENVIDCKLAEYSAEYPVILYVQYLMKASINSNWKEMCYAARCIIDIESNQNSFIMRLLKDLTKIVTLELALKTEECILNARFDQALEFIIYIIALVKGILKPEDIHTKQIQQTLEEASEFIKGKVPNDQYEKIRQEVFRYKTAFHVSMELDKAIKDFSIKALEDEIHKIQHSDLYTWKNIDERSPSNMMTTMMKQFSGEHKVAVDFHSTIYSSKQIMKYGDRKKYNYAFITL